MVGGYPVSLYCSKDAVIDVPASSQVHAQVVRKEADTRAIEVDAITRLCFITVREPDMHEPSGDLRRIAEALQEQWPDRVTGDISADLHILADAATWFCEKANGKSR